MYSIGSLYRVEIIDKKNDKCGGFLAPLHSNQPYGPTDKVGDWISGFYETNVIFLCENAYFNPRSKTEPFRKSCMKVLFNNKLYILLTSYVYHDLNECYRITLLSK